MWKKIRKWYFRLVPTYEILERDLVSTRVACLVVRCSIMGEESE